MDFSLNDEQRLLQESAQKFINGSYGFARRHASIHQHQSLDAGIWQQFAELGWLALPFAEADGGLGGSLADTMVLLQEFGRGLVVEPYIASVILGGGFLQRGGAAQKARYLSALMEGRLQIAVAIDEYEQAFSLASKGTLAHPEGDGFVLNGRKCTVLNGDKADLLIVLANCQNRGLGLFLVEAGSPGLHKHPHRTVDGHSAAEIALENVHVAAEAVLCPPGLEAQRIAEAVIAETILALGAEAVGALAILLHSTVSYAKTRQQFGVPIGSFQVLQHRMADMFMACEQCKSLLLAATLKTREGHADAAQAVHALKAQLGRGGRLIAQEAIQLHGGMGMTDELAIGHYFKRITAIDALFGNADHHLQAYAAAG